MHDENTLNCPVCRAKQKWQPTCRRCSADLRLLVKAFQSATWARENYRRAQQAGTAHQLASAWQYLRWLQPNRARDLPAPVAHELGKSTNDCGDLPDPSLPSPSAPQEGQYDDDRTTT